MSVLQSHAKEIISLLVPFLAWALGRFFKSRAKLQYSTRHGFTFLVNEPRMDQEGNVVSNNQLAHTRSFTVQNVGSDPATKMEVVFNYKPMYFNLWPVRPYEERILPDGRYLLKIDSLAPSEAINIELLNVNFDMPNLLSIRSDQSIATLVKTEPQIVLSSFQRSIVVFFLLMGVAATIYFSLVLLQFLILSTPMGAGIGR